MRDILLGCAILGLTSFLSYLILSDGHGVTSVHDGITRVGWPLLIFEKGGYVYHNEFHPAAALGDFVLAMATATLVRRVMRWALRDGSLWQKGPFGGI